MNQNELKKIAAEAALTYLKSATTIGVGTGSTVNYLIELIAEKHISLEAAVSSSEATATFLKQQHISLVDLNSVGELGLYIDGADEFNEHRYLIKGLGGALTREKIIAVNSRKFVCIVDESKQVDILGQNVPVPVEVIPMARSYVARQIVKLGGEPVYRQGVTTDNHNIILDVHNLKLVDPVSMEQHINAIPGVVENGIFAIRPADVILVGTQSGVREI